MMFSTFWVINSVLFWNTIVLYLKYHVTRGLGLLIEQLLLLHDTWNQENVCQAFSLVWVTSEAVFHMQNSMCSVDFLLFLLRTCWNCYAVCVYVYVFVCVWCVCTHIRVCVCVCVWVRTFLTCITMGSLESEYLARCIHCMVTFFVCVCVCVCVCESVTMTVWERLQNVGFGGDFLGPFQFSLVCSK